jgi:lysyl-tRNA synthetase class I
MTVEAVQHSADSIIPDIICPQCGKRMRLATVEPEGSDDRDRMKFDCECGFEYRLSERAGR